MKWLLSTCADLLERELVLLGGFDSFCAALECGTERLSIYARRQTAL